ncbi:MAG: hypothetical protein H0W33_05830 [Gammaproteobacteria bacterium]|nr:hypothetical protein [Gammaproteobacteria bacterium]
MTRAAIIVLLLAFGIAWQPAQAGGKARLGAIVYLPEHVVWLPGHGPDDRFYDHFDSANRGFYGHRYYPRQQWHYPRYYGHSFPYRYTPRRYIHDHGLRYHPRRDVFRNYRRFDAYGSFFPRGGEWYYRHRHDPYCGH